MNRQQWLDSLTPGAKVLLFRTGKPAKEMIIRTIQDGKIYLVDTEAARHAAIHNEIVWQDQGEGPFGERIEEFVMVNPIMKYFEYSHLPLDLQEISKAFAILAKGMNENLPDNDEKMAGLRKLLEAKDCFVRAKL